MSLNFTQEQLQKSMGLVYQVMSPTPQYVWPQLCELIGTEIWVKHENHTPTGAFKIRGAITFMDWLTKTHPKTEGIITATRGNHGQGQAKAATAAGLNCKIIVPHGNSVEKNLAMKSFGADLQEYGQDFNESCDYAQQLAERENLWMVPPFHPALLSGVASYGAELFQAVNNVDVLYVPIGCGSGICSLILLKELLQLKTDIVGVVSTEADAVKQSVEAGRIINTKTANTFADGMAVKKPVPEAFDIYSKSVSYIVSVSDNEVANAMRVLYRCTHNIAEGAGAAALAALIQDKEHVKGKRVAVILSGGNVDIEIYKKVLDDSYQIY